MKLVLQIAILFLSWLSNPANATPVFVKVILSDNEVIIGKTENGNEEAISIVGTQLKNKFECVKKGGLIYLVVTADSYEEAVHVASKCLLGIDMTVAEWKAMYDKITTYIGKNWNDPYLHGQAAVFVATIAIPITKLSKFSKLKLLNKLKVNSKFADKADELAKISKVADESGDVGKVVDDIVKVSDNAKNFLKSKGYSLFEEIDDVLFIRDANGKVGKVLDKARPENITWFTPQAGSTWQIHQINSSNYLRFKYGNNVFQQVKVKIYHVNGNTVDCFLDDLVFKDSKYLISDAKHSQKAAIVDGKIPGYTTNQTQGYQWIVEGNAARIEVIGDGGLPIITRQTDLLPDLDGKITILTNNEKGQIVESSILKTK